MNNKGKITAFLERYQSIWSSIEELESQLKSDEYNSFYITTQEEANEKLFEIQVISQKIKDKLCELEGTRIEERIFLNDLIKQHGTECVQKMISEIII
jgi:hypothetical protein